MLSRILDERIKPTPRGLLALAAGRLPATPPAAAIRPPAAATANAFLPRTVRGDGEPAEDAGDDGLTGVMGLAAPAPFVAPFGTFIAGGCFFGFATPGMLGSCVSAFFVAAFFGSAAVPVASRRRVLAPSDSAAALADSRSNSELRPPPPPAAAALAAIKTAAAAAAATPHPHCTA